MNLLNACLCKEFKLNLFSEVLSILSIKIEAWLRRTSRNARVDSRRGHQDGDAAGSQGRPLSCTSLSLSGTSEVSGLAALGAGSSPDTLTGWLSCKGAKEKRRACPEIGESLHKSRKSGHNEK